MNYRIGLNLALFCLCAALLGWYHKYSTPPSVKTIPTHLTTAQAKHIRFHYRDNPVIELYRDNIGWHVAAPVEIPANPKRIQRLLTILNAPVHTQLPVNESNLARFHLARPIAFLHINELVFAFGTTETLHSRRYVLFGEQIFLLDDRIMPLLNLPAELFASPRVLPATERIKRVNYTFCADGTWQHSNDTTVLTAWEKLTATSVSIYHAETATTNDWRFVLEVENDHAPRLHLDAQRQNNRWILRRADKKLEYHFADVQSPQALGLVTATTPPDTAPVSVECPSYPK